MNHPTELNLMMYAEEALGRNALGQETGTDEWQAVHEHLTTCATCRDTVEQLRQEAQGLSDAFALAVVQRP